MIDNNHEKSKSKDLLFFDEVALTGYRLHGGNAAASWLRSKRFILFPNKI